MDGKIMDIMMSLAKTYLKSLVTKDDLNNLLSKLLLSDNEYTVLKMVYLDNRNLGDVADFLGYSIQNVKIIHRKALLK
jgi:DNA-directed RNA polymerase specialized sigma subunit